MVVRNLEAVQWLPGTARNAARRADEMQRHCPMQTDAQQPIEPDKMIHVGVRHEDMTDAKELAGRERGQIAEIE